MWWTGTSSADANGLVRYFAEADAKRYFVTPDVTDAHTYTIPEDSPVLIDVDGVRFLSPMGFVKPSSSFLGEVIDAPTSQRSRGSTGVSDVEFFYCKDLNCTGTDPDYDSPRLTIYEIGEGTLSSPLKAEIDLIAQAANGQQLLSAQVQDLSSPITPVVPWFAQIQMGKQFFFDAKLHPVAFVAGKAIGFIANYDFYRLSIIRYGTLTYVVEGVTNDSKRIFVYVVYVSLIDLPSNDEYVCTCDGPYTQYLQKYMPIVDAAPDDHFTPRLSDIDAFIQTLQISDRTLTL